MATKLPTGPDVCEPPCAVVCMFCGKSWSYDGTRPPDDICAEACEHEKGCEKNPYLQEIKRLRDALVDAKHYLERIDGVEGQKGLLPKMLTDTAIKVGKAYSIIATALAGKDGGN